MRQSQPKEMKSRPGISKYFIAIVPPSPIYESAMLWKEFFKTNFNSKAALHSPPHITLHMPFEWKTSKEESLMEALNNFSASIQPFEIHLNNFGCFPPKVIFIQVMENKLLQELQASLSRFCKRELNLFNANRLDKPFHPHLTVAFRDLKKPDFQNAWTQAKDKEFNQLFSCRDLSLLKHNGKEWEVKTKFDFSN